MMRVMSWMVASKEMDYTRLILLEIDNNSLPLFLENHFTDQIVMGLLIMIKGEIGTRNRM